MPLGVYGLSTNRFEC